MTFDQALDQYGVWRVPTWRVTAEEIRKRGVKIMLETGSFRGSVPDGNSTAILAALAAEASGKLDSYELLPENIEVAKAMLGEIGLLDYVTFHQGDAGVTLKERTQPIEFVYFDAPDTLSPTTEQCQQMQLEHLQAIQHLLTANALLLFDDWDDATGGKSGLSIPHAKTLGFQEIVKDYQVLLGRPQ